MKDKIFIDTNILIYAYTSSEINKQKIALNLLYNHRKNIVMSTQVINEFSSTLIRKYKINPKILHPKVKNFFSLFNIVLINHSTIEKCFDLLKKYNFSYYDGLIVASALESKCLKLYSEDMQDSLLVENKLKIINPFKKEFNQ